MLTILIFAISCGIISNVQGGVHWSKECEDCPVQWPAPEISSKMWRELVIGVTFNEVEDRQNTYYSLNRKVDQSNSGGKKRILMRNGVQIQTLNLLTVKLIEDINNEATTNLVRSTGPIWLRHYDFEYQYKSESLPGYFKSVSNTRFFRFLCIGDIPNKVLHARVAPECVYNMQICYSMKEKSRPSDWSKVDMVSVKSDIPRLPITIKSAILRQTNLRIEYDGEEDMDISLTESQTKTCKEETQVHFVIYYEGKTVMESHYKSGNMELYPVVGKYAMPLSKVNKGYFEVNFNDNTLYQDQIRTLDNRELNYEINALSWDDYALNGLHHQFYSSGSKKLKLALSTCKCHICREWLLSDLVRE